MSDKKNAGDALKGAMGDFVDSLMTPAPAEPTTGEGGATATLRYSTETVEVLIEDVNKTIRQHFEDHSEELGLPNNGNLGVRSEGSAVDADSKPESSRTYTASVARETKGCN